MLKRNFLFIIAVLVTSATYASDSTIIQEKASINEVTAVTLPSNSAGIKVELADKNLRKILADVMKINNGKIGEILGRFLNNTSHWIWIIDEGYLPENVNAMTQLTAQGAITSLDYDKFENATDLSVARTLIHEIVHAYLTVYFMYEPGNAIKDYPVIVNAWGTSKNPDYNKIQHDEIERSFIDEIASALDEYSEIVGLHNVDQYVYTDLAWGGLNFQDSIQLTSKIKKRIQNRLSAEQLNKPFGTERPVSFSLDN